MRKLFCFVLALIISTGAAACALAGEYTASAKGFGGDVVVTLTIENNAILSASAVGEKETVGIGSQAIETMPAEMLEANSVNVDTVTGATFTSNAILTAAADALAQSGAVLEPNTEKKDTVAYEDTSTDVVIVGAGIAGMTAATKLADAGIQVMLIEKTDVLGGAAVTSHGGFWAMGAEPTASVYDFTADELYDAFSRLAPPVYNKDVLYTIANNSIKGYDFTVECNAPITGIGYCNEKADPRFMGFSMGNLGAGLMGAISDAMSQRDIDVRTNTTVTKLIQAASGEITGIVAEYEGQPFTVTAKKVILATGGFGHNPEMLAQYAAGAEKLATNYTFSGSTGDGQKMGVEVGGVLVGDGYMGYAATPPDMGNMDFGKPLTVNDMGVKVSGADDHYTTLHKIIAEQDNQSVYVIFPANMSDYNGVENSSEILESHYQDGTLVKAETIEALAGMLNIDADTLQKTVDKHNELCANGQSDEFNTAVKYMIPVEKGPFYAHVRQTCIIGTITGLSVNEDMQVLKADGQPIDNLFAIGELIYGNIFNGNYPISGTGLCIGLSSACVVSESVAEQLN